MSDPTVSSYLTKLLCSRGGRLPRSLLPTFLQLSTEQIEKILQDESQKFPLAGELVLARSPVRTCTKYMEDIPEEECDNLHLCRHYLQGECKRQRCSFSHNISSYHNLKVLEANEISGLNEDEIKVLLLQNDNQLLPGVCDKYLGDSCDLGEDCSRLHICGSFLRGECDGGDCGRSHHLLEFSSDLLLSRSHIPELSIKNFQTLCTVRHNERLQEKQQYKEGTPTAVSGPRKRKNSADVSQSQGHGRQQETAGSNSERGSGERPMSEIEESYHLSWTTMVDENPLKRFIIQDQMSPGAAHPSPVSSVMDGHNCSIQSALPVTEVSSAPHTNPDKVPEICLSNLWKYCKLEGRCPDMHFYLPYRWQIYIGISWRDISNMENIEKYYCAPEVDRVQSIDFLTMRSGDHSVRRLSTISSVMKPPEYVLTTEWLWYWKDENDDWTQYGHYNEKKVRYTASSSDLENVYLADATAIVPFIAGNHQYEINFQEMKQRNLKYRTEKDVRRRPRYLSFEDVKLLRGSTKSSAPQPPLWSAAVFPLRSAPSPLKTDIYPRTWNTAALPEIGCKKVLVSERSGEFSEIVGSFTKTVRGHMLKKLWRLQNTFLWQVFQQQKKQMKKLNRGRDVKEMRLFHGTKNKHIDAICNQNFDWRLCGTHGTRFGQGSYFARDASYSHNYCTPTPSGTHSMFVARVLVGDYMEGTSEMKRPPLKPGSSSWYYDSSVDNVTDPAIFVVFEKHQIYPEYLLEYEQQK